MMAAFDLHTIAQYSALRIVESLAEGMVIFAFAAVLLRIVPRQSAGTRFAIWFSTLMAIAIAPVVTGIWSSQITASRGYLVHPAITVPESWAAYLFTAWALVAGWFLMGVGRALWRLRSLKRSCSRVDVSSLEAPVQKVLQVGSLKRYVELCTSEQVRVPTAIGLAEPMVVVPRWVLEELSSAELQQILIHEIAHLRRRDDWTNLIQQLVKAVFFFHPAVWWIEKNVALEREVACDDVVLAETQSPRAYAECLAHLAERTLIQRSVALAQAALGKVRQTSARVAQILDGNRPETNRTWKPAVSLVAGAALVFSIGASKLQRLIAFESDSPAPIARTSDVVLPSAARGNYMHHAMFHANQLAPTTAKQANPAVGSVEHRSSIRSKQTRAIVVKPKPDPMMHLARSNDSVIPIRETVVLFIQGADRNSDNGAYDIQMWRVTVVRYVVQPASTTTPGKQT
jgi:beta-lactamase regulating signal transducer with metallopeptidase domain